MEVINSHFSSGFDAGRNSAMDECMCEIEQLRAQVTLLQQEVTESKARVLELEEAAQDVQTLSAECFTLHERIAELEKDRDAFRDLSLGEKGDNYQAMQEQIAAQQLAIQQMKNILDPVAFPPRMSSPRISTAQELAKRALAIQPSTEALAAYVEEQIEARLEAFAWTNQQGDYFELSTPSTVYGSHTIPLYKLKEKS